MRADAVTGVRYVGAAEARPAPGVLEAIADADAVVFCPSNPVVSIGPILAVPGVRDAVAARRDRAVGVSGIVGGAPVAGMADKLMPAVGIEVSAAGVADHYRDLLSGWLLDDARRGIGPRRWRRSGCGAPRWTRSWSTTSVPRPSRAARWSCSGDDQRPACRGAARDRPGRRPRAAARRRDRADGPGRGRRRRGDPEGGVQGGGAHRPGRGSRCGHRGRNEARRRASRGPRHRRDGARVRLCERRRGRLQRRRRAADAAARGPRCVRRGASARP